VSSRLDPAQLSLAARYDPEHPQRLNLGLVQGWDSVSLGGKPSLDLGVSGLEAHRLNAAMPTDGLLRPAQPFVLSTRGEMRRRAERCLTQAIYYEAALEPARGQAAVAQVVLNRVRDPNYPNSICGVVYQGAERVTGCQFSFTCDGSLGRPPVDWAWRRAQLAARQALAGQVATEVGTATHYHADYVHPWWSPTLGKLTQIGAHIFYRWKGLAGESAAFRQLYAGHEPLIDEARFARPRIDLSALDEISTLEDATEALDAAAAQGETATRTVVIDGQTRVVGVTSLGGRRIPTPAEVAAINESLGRFERGETAAPAAPATPVPEGVTPMQVEEVGRPPAR
jgi:Cell wall hydrolyses involved in spore germination